MNALLRRAAAYATALVAAAALAPAPARAQLDSPARWRELDTPHFRVYFTPGLEPLARRAGVRAEEAYAEITRVLVHPPTRRVNLVVTDNVDYSNGFTTVFPRNRIIIYAHPPVDDPELAYYDDWLDLVITHELTHTFHLDYARGLPLVPRAVFGRIPLSFPETTTPTWTKEGLAVYLESRLTHAGRIHGTMNEMELRTAVLDGTFFSIDRASGNPVSWPGGNTPYAYGSLFEEYLAERYGPERAGEFVRRYGGYVIPFLNDQAARKAYGVTFSRAWSEWRASVEARARAVADSVRRAGATEPRILTRGGWNAEFPRWSPDGRWIAYGAYTGRDQPQERLVDATGAERTLAPRTSLAPGAWTADGSIVTSMLDLRRQYYAYSDLYRITPGGHRERLTHGARLMEPDVARDGRIVAVRSGGGTTVPVIAGRDGAEPRELVPASLDVQWAFPRWSPDGTRIAIDRWRAGGYHDVVIIDPAGRVVTQVTDDRAVDMAAAWSPDGRYLLFSSDRTGIANLYAWDGRDGRLMQVTNVVTGAFQPDVSPDGKWLAFQYYRGDGYHVALLPFDPASWRPAPPVDARFAPQPDADPARAAAGAVHGYSPVRTGLPAYWQPAFYQSTVFGTAAGVATSGNDVVERHVYAATVETYLNSGKTEAGAGYLYRGLGNPVLGVSALQHWRVRTTAVVAGGGGESIVNRLLERERSLSAVATFSRPRYRSYAWLSVGANAQDRHREWSSPADSLPGFVDAPPQVGAIATAGITTTRAYQFSISPEDGVLAAASVEGRRYTRARAGEDVLRGYTRVDGRLDAFHGFPAWGFARHVMAVRAVGGADFGSLTPYFSVGGVSGDGVAFPLGSGFSLGESPDLFVRGYPDGAQFGDRAAAATAEWRFPVALVERGYKLVPVFLNQLWGTAFTDAGTAWCVQGCDPSVAAVFRKPDPLVSVGAELGANVFLGFNVGFQLRGGVAVPLRAANDLSGARVRPSPRFYFTLGQSF